MKGRSSKRVALKVDALQDRKIYCLHARPCIFQPGNFTGWGSERVKNGPVCGIAEHGHGRASVCVSGPANGFLQYE